MTIQQIQNIHSRGKAIPNKVYSAIDKNGKLLTWIGTTNGRLKLQQDSKASTTTTNITNTTTNPTAGVQSVNSGTDITVDNTDPANPIINYTGSGSGTNLGYTASPTDGTVTSDTGTDATIPLADTTNAGLLAPGDKTKLNNTSGTNTGDQDLTPYLTIVNAASTYQPLDSDLTSWATITRATGFDTFVATPSSANLASLITDEVGTGSLVLQSYVDDKKSFLSFSNNTFNPADSTVYYSGGFASVGPSTTAALRRIYFPSACTITDCTLFIVTNVNGSGETVNFAIRLNNTTDTALTSGTISATATTIVTTGLSISVSAGSYIELKITTPAWVTNPTGTFISGTLSLKI